MEKHPFFHGVNHPRRRLKHRPVFRIFLTGPRWTGSSQGYPREELERERQQAERENADQEREVSSSTEKVTGIWAPMGNPGETKNP